MTTAILFDDKFASGHLVRGIPEGPDRTAKVMSGLQESGLLESTQLIIPKPVDLRILQLVHSAAYIEAVRSSCASRLPHVEFEQQVDPKRVWYDQVAADSNNLGELTPSALLDLRRKIALGEQSSTPLAHDTYELGLLAAGAVVDACDKVMSAEVRNAFCVVRPPGHHAEYDAARGFCFFNNVAVGAAHLLNRYKLEKVLIIDVDVHHGNGAQHSFYESDQVLVCNIHRTPSELYPGNCGFAKEMGAGKGLGFNLNIPLPGNSGSQVYLQSLALIERFAHIYKPQFVLLSFGVDAHEADRMGGMQLSTGFFGMMTEKIRMIADRHTDGRMVSVFEGGYNRDVLGPCAVAHVKQLLKKD